ncbi:thiosulfate sulfurtransferase/rhodanese-like domain-containing protein 3 [Falco biarmicus]|uniref:thiosulfate sulfurtransferase/rhodanese-like domain-containing protein 3 n=1 Tax=Falco peregrinus TaxID=8954 RepID=UPI0018866615|nr:thiosulfate sulfurtransferase/rhodanese-like domain-containing protein 3 [Falco peregrinus]XP_014142418.2 thiosulfate sulfurtransferase/rhodanese-like domain-containing protein 3 [Falco cherrug]XP_037248638.1 thiosulfate sulfurtransferase/rhodanese-like domain-containing protein 3 isoform X1 [Falco rusticolus]XP_056200767.1 thiosulfate sulfurtransferase/rhodanese-like domain-containing protein 3 [Falco biarmicus]
MAAGGRCWRRAARALRAASGWWRAAAPGEAGSGAGGWASPRAGGGVRFAGARGSHRVKVLNLVGGHGLPRGAGTVGACAGLTGCASWSGPGAADATSRGLCTGGAPGLSYQELKDLKKTGVLHIDVRERWEIDRSGKIPASINIPLGELVEALQMDPAEFKEQYNQKMPTKTDLVVFSCLAGTRSKQALGFATSLGFSRVQQYAGGFQDWVKHEPPEKK